MKKRFIIILGLIFLFLLFHGVKELSKRETEKPAPTELPVRPKVLAFYEEGWGGIYAGSFGRLQEIKGKVDIASPVWLGLKADGKVGWDKANAEAVDFFAQNQLEFLILVTAGSGKNGSSILSNEKFRRNALGSIAAYLKTMKADGICLDFEYLNPTLKEEFIQFIKELKATLEGKKLLVTVFPYIDWAEPTKEVYAYHSLGEISDGVIVMTYDQHRPKDKPGSIASRDWVKRNLSYLLSQIDSRKLWLGIAGYGYRWQTGKKQAVALPAWYCREKSVGMGFADTYHPEMGNDFLQYAENGNTYTIWWESARSMQEKLGLAAEHNLAGVALWRLGYEEEGFWEFVKDFR